MVPRTNGHSEPKRRNAGAKKKAEAAAASAQYTDRWSSTVCPSFLTQFWSREETEKERGDHTCFGFGYGSVTRQSTLPSTKSLCHKLVADEDFMVPVTGRWFSLTLVATALIRP